MEQDTFINWIKAITSNQKSNIIKTEKPIKNGMIITETWIQGGKQFGIKKTVFDN
jgi:hypothetical protein